MTAALDCGLVVNPEGAKNQVEGSIVMGMGTALYEAIDGADVWAWVVVAAAVLAAVAVYRRRRPSRATR